MIIKVFTTDAYLLPEELRRVATSEHVFSRKVKRAVDISLAVILLVGTAPLLCCIAGAILLTMGRPVLFRQPRGGYRGSVFSLVKFRTMNERRDRSGNLALPVERLTGLGRVLRRLSLDELPQLWNVLKGDMSLIGPRPLLASYLPLYSSYQKIRHEMRPGITGLAQVHGRDLLTWDKKFQMDVWYVTHWSLWLDLQIAADTVGVVLRGSGNLETGYPAEKEFTGPAESTSTCISEY